VDRDQWWTFVNTVNAYETSGIIKFSEFLDQLRKCWLLKNYSSGVSLLVRECVIGVVGRTFGLYSGGICFTSQPIDRLFWLSRRISSGTTRKPEIASVGPFVKGFPFKRKNTAVVRKLV
jgi:hypothetical protein